MSCISGHSFSRRRQPVRCLIAVLALALAALPLAARAQQITGAGATLPAPLYDAWGHAAEAAIGIRLNYQAFSSGTGATQALNRTVDFGASDEPIAAAQLQSGHLLQFPTVIGAVVMIVNIPGLQANQLKLTGELIAGIYLGKIAWWNDPRIAEVNRDLKLPGLAIVPIFRAGTSGTNFVFTSYLSASDAAWRQHVGTGTSVHWPAGAGARSNSNAGLTVSSITGAIGYTGSAYATQNHLITAQLRNKAGQFVTPNREAFSAAAASADWKNATNFAINLIDQGGDRSWPMAAATFVLLPENPRDAAASANVVKFFDWAYTNGGKTAEEMDYIPLPPEVQDAVRQTWKASVKGPDGKPILQ
nr:phosphate ABC transporter substrate-binding protein PstS [uncultured Rhodopila sp.]